MTSKTLFTSRAFLYQDQYVVEHTPSVPSRGVFVLLHGFPAWVSKNYDVAEQLALLGYQVYIPHHRGLGQSPGAFRFGDCLTSTGRLLEEIKQRHSSLSSFNLLGHSWGGYLCLRHLSFATDRLILLAPLAVFPEPPRAQALVSGLYRNNTTDLQSYDFEELSAEFAELARGLSIGSLGQHLASLRTLLLYGRQDEVIPSDLLDRFAQEINGAHLSVIVSDDDHRLSKRRRVLQQIRQWMEGA
jgi:pimeloyl-ACP methyl ester carboxylesterase